MTTFDFDSVLTANPVFFRTYSRRTKEGLRETWEQTSDRTLRGLMEIAGLDHLTQKEVSILDKMLTSFWVR